jgi:Gas vesicle protein G
MSLLSEIFLLPFAPVRGVVWLGERIAEQAEEVRAEQEDPRRALDELSEARERGGLTDDEYAAAEEALLRELVPEPVYLDPEEPEP